MISQEFEARGNHLYKFMSGIFNQILSKILIIEEIQRYEADLVAPESPEYIDFVMWDGNEFLQRLEQVFERHSIEGNFGIIISDLIMKGYKKEYAVDPFYLMDKHKAFKNYINIIERQDLAVFPLMQKLIANTLIKYYLEVYVDIIHKNMKDNDFQLQPDELAVMDDVQQRILDSSIKVTLQAYCLKRIKQLFNLNTLQLKKFCKERLINSYRWAQDADLGEPDSDLPVNIVPKYEPEIQADRLMQNLVRNIVQNNDLQAKGVVLRLFQECDTPDKRIKIGLVFLKAVYIRYSLNEPMSQTLLSIFNDELIEIAEANLGKEYAMLLLSFIQNFPQNNFLKMEPR